jgi:hypothetical protein
VSAIYICALKVSEIILLEIVLESIEQFFTRGIDQKVTDHGMAGIPVKQR